MKSLFLKIILLFCLLSFIAPVAVLAIECAPGDILIIEGGEEKCLLGTDKTENVGLGHTTSDIRAEIQFMINIGLGFLGLAGVIMVIYGGALILTSRGNADQVAKGRGTIIWASIGIIIIVIAWTITSYVMYVGRSL